MKVSFIEDTPNSLKDFMDDITVLLPIDKKMTWIGD